MIERIMKEKKLVVFDLDGTLFDSQLCFAEIRSALGLSLDAPLLEHIETLSHTQKQYFSEAICQIEERCAAIGSLYPQVPHLLQTLVRQQFTLAVWTRNSSKATEMALGQYQSYFAAVKTREHSEAKPHPQGLTDILAAVECKLEEALFIGDSHYDFIAARNIGISTIIINPQLKENCEKEAHIHYLSSLDEFLHLVEL